MRILRKKHITSINQYILFVYFSLTVYVQMKTSISKVTNGKSNIYICLSIYSTVNMIRNTFGKRRECDIGW